MGFLFGKKQTVQALAELLEDGRAAANQEMKNARYNEYAGAEPMIEIAVRVRPENEPPFEAHMKAGLTRTYVLLLGVRVLVSYDPRKRQKVTLAEEVPAILERNPQIVKKP